MRTFLIVVFLIFIKTGESQTVSALSFQMSFPVGAYKSKYPKTGTGFLFSIQHQLKSLPFFGIGGQVGILQVSNANKQYEGIYHDKYDVYNISASNYIITVSPNLRVNLHTFKNSAKVFADIGVGSNIFLSYTTITNTNTNRNEVIYDLFGNTASYDLLIRNNNLHIDS